MIDYLLFFRKMGKHRFIFLIIILGIIHNSCSSSKIISKSDGEVIGQKTCTPDISIGIPETKIEILSFLSWDLIEPVISPTIIGGIDSLKSVITYPEIAMRARVSGPVICEFIINSQGKADKLKIIKGVGAGCDEAVLDALKSVNYIPAQKDGKKINQLMRASINFILIKSKP